MGEVYITIDNGATKTGIVLPASTVETFVTGSRPDRRAAQRDIGLVIEMAVRYIELAGSSETPVPANKINKS